MIVGERKNCERRKRVKKQNSGNQPEFQSSIKKRTVIETVVAFNIFSTNVQFYKDNKHSVFS
jgi:hypothetical protein